MSWERAQDDRLFGALGGTMAFELLRTASAVGLFELLHQQPGLARDEIAVALGLATYPVEVLLLGLVPLGLINRVGNGYQNHPELSGPVASGALGKVIDYFHLVVNPGVRYLEASVRANRPVGLRQLFGDDATSFYAAVGRDEAYGECFRRAMRADTDRNREQVAASPVFASLHKLLDVGGSTGDMAVALSRRHPLLRVTVVDLPDVAARALAIFRALGLYPRLDAIACDILREPLPRGFDGILLAHLLDIFGPTRVRAVLDRAFDALDPGGTLIIFGSAMDDDEKGPLTYGVLSSYFLCLAEGEGRFYSAAQTAEALRTTGFVDIEVTRLPRHEVLITARRPRAVAPIARSGSSGGALARSPRSTLGALVRLGRPKFLVYSTLFYALGTAAAVLGGATFPIGRWLHGLGFVLLAHLMTHYANEYFDLPADSANPAPTRWTGGSRVLVEGHLPPGVSLAAAFVLASGAATLALLLPTPVTRWIAFGMLFLGWSYTAPPLRLNYRSLGEVTVATVLTLAVPALAYLLSGGALASPVLLGLAVPMFVAQVARMILMNLADVAGDRQVGKKTLAVTLGPDRALRAVALGELVAYGAIVVFAVMHLLPLLAAAAMLVTLPVALGIVRRAQAGALRDPRLANGVVFWASTHVALLTAAAILGLLATSAIYGTP